MSGDESSTGPTIAARASMAWDVVAAHDARATPGPAASVQALIAREHVRRGDASRGDARPLLRILVPGAVTVVVTFTVMTGWSAGTRSPWPWRPASVGHRMLTHMETALPAGLTRDAAACLTIVVDDVCPPA